MNLAILSSNLTFWTNRNLVKWTIAFSCLWCDIRSILVSGHNDVMVRYVTLNAPILSNVSAVCHTWCVAGWQMLREQRSPKGQGLLRKEGPPTYAILSRNLVMSRFTHFLKGFHRAFNESHPAFEELSMKAILLS